MLQWIGRRTETFGGLTPFIRRKRSRSLWKTFSSTRISRLMNFPTWNYGNGGPLLTIANFMLINKTCVYIFDWYMLVSPSPTCLVSLPCLQLLPRIQRVLSWRVGIWSRNRCPGFFRKLGMIRPRRKRHSQVQGPVSGSPTALIYIYICYIIIV